MTPEAVAALRLQWTDRQVTVAEEGRPEWRRFRGCVGRVKTVNMNGRALVEFDVRNDPGWYDFPISALRPAESAEPAAGATSAPA